MFLIIRLVSRVKRRRFLNNGQMSVFKFQLTLIKFPRSKFIFPKLPRRSHVVVKLITVLRRIILRWGPRPIFSILLLLRVTVRG